MNNISDTHPSKVFKYCPKCGNEEFKFEGTKVFVCSHCQFNYYINPAPATAAIIELPDKRIILTKRKYDPMAGFLDLPGGFADIGESIESGVIREIKEELGIELKNPVFITSFPNEYVYKGISYYTLDFAFLFHLDHIPEIKPKDDVLEAIFYLPEKIDFSMISFPSITNILKHYIDMKN